MSRGKWGWRPRKAHKMGICLLHRREVGYEEGKRKGCFSRRRCKWFRAPGESLIAAVPEDAACPVDAEEDEEPEEDDEGKERMYECQSCGFRFEGPAYHKEWTEAWGRMVAEEVSGCPRCGGGYIEVYV